MPARIYFSTTPFAGNNNAFDISSKLIAVVDNTQNISVNNYFNQIGYYIVLEETLSPPYQLFYETISGNNMTNPNIGGTGVHQPVDPALSPPARGNTRSGYIANPITGGVISRTLSFDAGS